MERDDRAPLASFFADDEFSNAATIVLDERVAHHIRVKRMEPGDAIRLTDGNGTVAFGSLVETRTRSARVVIDRVESVEQPSPLHLRVPIADRDRMLWLAEKSTELGITTWQQVRFRRSASVSPRGEGAAFAEKVRARMISALEQSGGAWLPRLLPEITPEALALDAAAVPVLLDAEGSPITEIVAASGDRHPVVLFGPEGGIEPDERASLIGVG